MNILFYPVHEIVGGAVIYLFIYASISSCVALGKLLNLPEPVSLSVK